MERMKDYNGKVSTTFSECYVSGAGELIVGKQENDKRNELISSLCKSGSQKEKTTNIEEETYLCIGRRQSSACF